MQKITTKHPTQVHKEGLSRGEKMAIKIVNWVGTIYFFILCNILAFSILFAPSLTGIIQFISSGWLQLVLLPLMLIANNIQADHAEKRADAIYELTLKVEELLQHK